MFSLMFFRRKKMRDKVFNKKKFIESVTDHVKSMYRKTLKDASQQ